MKKRSYLFALRTSLAACAAAVMFACTKSSNADVQTLGSDDGGDDQFVAGATITPSAVSVETLTENPKGFGFTLWLPQSTYEVSMLRDFGRRPFERVGFWNWSSIETKSAKNYSGADNVVARISLSQKYGQTPVIALNNISGPWFGTGKTSNIPSFYAQNFTNLSTFPAATHTALLNYVDYMVGRLLTECGQLVVTFDYEMMSNCTPDTPDRQQLLSQLFVDEAKQARQTAEKLGMADRLKILPIVNGNCTNPSFSKTYFNTVYGPGHVPARWMLDIMDQCDYLGIDTYYFDKNNPSSCETTMAAWQFWTQNYSEDKPVYMTENGWSTGNDPASNTVDATVVDTSGKAVGTEANQHDYYANLTAAIRQENVPGGRLNGQARMLNVWMYRDNDTGKDSWWRENYFGVVRMDGTCKPAFDVLHDFAASLDATYDPDNLSGTGNQGDGMSPSMLFKVVAVNTQVSKNNPVKTVYNDGLNLDRIVATFATKPGSVYKLKLEFANAGSTIVKTGDQWDCVPDNVKPEFIFTATGDQTTVWVIPTDGRVPFRQSMKSIALEEEIKIKE